MASIKSQVEDEIESQFTSMIDVVFLLLIFFILQPFKAPDFKMMAYLPKDDASMGVASADMKPTINLLVEGDRNRATYYVNEEMVKPPYIASRLLKISEGDNEVPVAIKPADTIYFEHVLWALDQCAIAGMTKVSFASK